MCLIYLTLDKLGAMFPEGFWWIAVCAVISSLITVLLQKLLEDKRLGAPHRGIGQQDSCKPEKRPEEHDERFC